MLVFFDFDDVIYYGELPHRKAEISFQQVKESLKPIPFSEIYPEWPTLNENDTNTKRLTQAPAQASANVAFFIKRPMLSLYDLLSRHNQTYRIPQSLLEEAYAMEHLSKHPHPHIIKYHGCCPKKGYVVGIVLDRYSYTLTQYLKKATGPMEKEAFMGALESAISHLHSLGWAHNDLNPGNIMVNDLGLPVVIDFDSARPIGDLLGSSRGTAGWYEGRIEDYTTSEKGHDIYALNKIRVWLDSPTFDEKDDEYEQE